ncbi:MAG TPA: hypothetical protein VFE59_20715 [Trebonia sp.]|nr:hypothetical protein [Trebonia sp.]
MSRAAELSRNLAATRDRIAAACAAAGRDPAEITLIAVTKTYPAADVLALARLGLTDFGESNGGGTPAGTWSVPPAQAAGQPGHAGTADPVAEVPAQPASDVPSGYQPAPVSFVSDDDGEYGAKPGYGGYDQDHGGDAGQGSATPGWKDSGRAGKQDKVFDGAGRRRPVVFEEEDDLDVPDFLK